MNTINLNFIRPNRTIKLLSRLVVFGLLATTEAFTQNFWQQTNGPYGGAPYGRTVYAFVINSRWHIFAGTQESGVFRSTDNGDTWRHIGLANTSVLSLVINSSGDIFAGTSGGVFRSSDNGDSWMPVNTGLTDTRVQSLVINLTTRDIFAGTFQNGIFRSTDNGDTWKHIGLPFTSVQSLAINSIGHIFAGGEYRGVYRSVDNGDSWTEVNVGLANDTDINALAINSNGYIFAGTGRGVFRSTDNSDTWKQVGSPAFVRSLVINSQGQIFFAATGWFYRSTDNGDTWKQVILPFTSDVQSLAINSSGHIFAGIAFSGEVYRSVNNGDTWRQVALPNTYVQSLAINSSGHIFAGTSGGVFRSSDNGDTWKQGGSAFTSVQSLAINSSGHIFAATSHGLVFRSIDNGDTWEYLILPPNTVVRTFAINSSEHIFAATGSGVFRSTDNGDTWKQGRLPFASGVWSLAINSRGHIFAGTSSGVFRSTDNGDTWKQGGLPFTYVRSFAINSSGQIFAGTDVGVFRSPDNGDAWWRVGSISSQSLSINSSEHIFAGTDVSVFRSIDGGKNWIEVNSGLNQLNVSPLAINSNGDIFVGTNGGGVFRAVHPIVKHTPTSLQETSREIPIVVNITAATGINSVTLCHRNGGDAEFRTVTMSKQGDVYKGSILADAVTSRGLEYFIVATDSADHIKREPSSNIFSIQIRVVNEIKPTAQPNGTEKTAYRLFSVPFQLNDPSPSAVLVDNLGEYNIKKWRLYGLSNGQYVQFPNAGTFTRGISLFLIVKDPDKKIDAGSGQSIKTDKEFSMALAPGHNFIALPFNFSIPANKLRLASGSSIALQTYTGDWVTVNELAPWRGYYLANNRSIPDTLFINPNLSPDPLLQAANKTNVKGWQVQILATCDEARDTQNFAGFAPESGDGWDDNDLVEPPPIGEYVSLYFPHPEWRQFLKIYCTDYRSESADGYVWEFEVKTNIRDKVNLTFEGIEEVPNELEVWLVDDALKITQNLREMNHYAVAGSEQPKPLKLVVGKHEFIGEKLAGAQLIPTSYELSQNFPNPFNPATTIRYGLPQAERVTLKIYNLLGEEVALIINDELRTAGYHAAIWDGRNKNDRVVASGVYVYRMQAGSFVMTKKLALIK